MRTTYTADDPAERDAATEGAGRISAGAVDGVVGCPWMETNSDPQAQRLLEQAVESGNMKRAWKQVKRNKGGKGVDDRTIADTEALLKTEWPAIRQSILAETYQPKPVKRVEIPKPGGGTRKLGVPTVVDRLIQQAICQVLTPIFDPAFSDHSYGFRPGRSAHDAIRLARVGRKVKDKRLKRLRARLKKLRALGL